MNSSHALTAHHAKHEQRKVLKKSLLMGRKRYEGITKPCFVWKHPRKGMMKGRRLGRISRLRTGVQKRMKTLKGLIPGGETLDCFSLLGETIDYIITLQAQVSLMRMLTELLEVSKLWYTFNYSSSSMEVYHENSFDSYLVISMHAAITPREVYHEKALRMLQQITWIKRADHSVE
ncbi:hypothetical protein HPP92_015856 [Vanilla planifolia]|uniref:Uncharacterized protein n=1 Tax=Vanilla planifolia TaxID=51239 RepID=A0A835QQ90_VANPL|nr:hypothetical protein HPP92_015856 [Vanilla planifolia]